MSYKRYLITVTDNLSATSMPFNEFVLYRKTHFPEEKQIVYLLFKTKADDSVQIPDDIKVYYIGKNRKQISETTKRLVNEANEHQIPVVFHIHEAKSVLLFNIATRFRYYDKIIYTLHSTYKNYPLHNKVFCACASLMVKDVVCVSKTSYKYYPWYLKALRRNHVQAVQNGVDIDRINDAVCNIKERRENKTFTLIYVARLIPLKRHKILIDALQYSQNTRLIFIGTGPLENELKKMLKKKG